MLLVEENKVLIEALTFALLTPVRELTLFVTGCNKRRTSVCRRPFKRHRLEERDGKKKINLNRKHCSYIICPSSRRQNITNDSIGETPKIQKPPNKYDQVANKFQHAIQQYY